MALADLFRPRLRTAPRPPCPFCSPVGAACSVCRAEAFGRVGP